MPANVFCRQVHDAVSTSVDMLVEKCNNSQKCSVSEWEERPCVVSFFPSLWPLVSSRFRLRLCVCVCACACACACVCVSVFIHTHTDIHTYTHLSSLNPKHRENTRRVHRYHVVCIHTYTCMYAPYIYTYIHTRMQPHPNIIRIHGVCTDTMCFAMECGETDLLQVLTTQGMSTNVGVHAFDVPNVCVCVCVYIYIYIYTNIYMYVCVYIYKHIHICMYVYGLDAETLICFKSCYIKSWTLYSYIHRYIHKWKILTVGILSHTCMHACIHDRIGSCNAFTFTYIHTYIDVHSYMIILAVGLYVDMAWSNSSWVSAHPRGMCVCVCACMYVWYSACMCVYMYVDMAWSNSIWVSTRPRGMCVCVCACMCSIMHVCVYVCMWTWLGQIAVAAGLAHIHEVMHEVGVYVCVHACMCRTMHACVYIYTHAYIHTYIHTCTDGNMASWHEDFEHLIHTFIHTYTYIHT